MLPMAVRIPLPSLESFDIFNSDFGAVVSAVEGTFVPVAVEPKLILPISLTNEVPQNDEEYFVTYCPTENPHEHPFSFQKKKPGFSYLEQLPMVFFPRVGLHRHSFVNGIRDLLRVPRVHHDTPVQTLRGTSELGQDHHALSILLTSDVLVRDLTKVQRPSERTERSVRTRFIPSRVLLTKQTSLTA